jgi:hypothetical protein
LLFIGEALLELNVAQQFPLPPHSGTTGASVPPLLFLPTMPLAIHVKMDNLRQMNYRQRAKNSLSILTLPRKLPLLAYRRGAM